ncbi:MAG TPA: cytochrome P450 [Pseudonocardia sp.]|jgi:cytochrome P450
MSTTTAAIDLLSSASFAAGHPAEQYRWLRENAPVYWHEEPDGPGFWAVTTHQLVREASMRPKDFSNTSGILIADFPPEELEFVQSMILSMDPPRHSSYRRLVGGLFTPKRAEGWRESISNTVRTILDEACQHDQCDLVTDIAGKLPSYVIAELLGIPREDGVELYRLTEIVHSAPDAVTIAERGAAMHGIAEYGFKVREDKLANPGQDLASRLVTAEVDGQRLTALEFASFFVLLIDAGGDTTRNLIGGAMANLLAEPHLYEWLRDNTAELMPTTVDELLRFQSPVIYMRRTATTDTELGGTKIATGDKVVLYYGAANRDPSVFDRAEQLVLDRTPNDQLAFGGGGAHFCLGSNFGRIEIAEMMTQLPARLGNLELAGEPTWLASNFISGPTSLPVRYTPLPG